MQGLPTYFAGAESFVTPFNATAELSAALSPNSDGSRPGNMNVSLVLRIFNAMSAASLQNNERSFSNERSITPKTSRFSGCPSALSIADKAPR